MPLAFLFIVGARIVPALGDVDDAGRRAVEAILTKAIAARPPALRRQLVLFLNVMRWAPFARYGRPFDRLSGAQQDAVLGWFQDAPIAALRSGFWGVKTLVFMGYYGRPDAGDSIAYRPSRHGNERLHA
jgi:hypothetical protein